MATVILPFNPIQTEIIVVSGCVVWKSWVYKRRKESGRQQRALLATASPTGYRTDSSPSVGRKFLTARKSILGLWFRGSLKWVLWVCRKTKRCLVWKSPSDRLFLAIVHEHSKPCYSLCRLQKAQPAKHQEWQGFQSRTAKSDVCFENILA